MEEIDEGNIEIDLLEKDLHKTTIYRKSIHLHLTLQSNIVEQCL